MIGPRYNEDTDTISGCKRGSLEWWHEAGHRWLNRRGYYNLHNTILYFTCPFITAYKLARGDLLGAKAALGLWLFFALGHELFAWGFAFWHYHPRRKPRAARFGNNI